MNPIRPFAALVGAAAVLAFPVAAGAKPHDATEHGHGNGHAHEHGHSSQPKTVGYVFKGTWSGGSVHVTKGNKHVRRAELVGTDVAFDLTDAKIVVADNDGDGAKDLADVQDGDSVLVKARLPKGDPGDVPFAARKLVDQTHESSSDDEDTGDDGSTGDDAPGGDDDPAGDDTP